MSALLKKKWLLIWVVMGSITPLLSFFAGLGYMYMLVVLLPLGQFVSLFFKENSRYSSIWMLQSVYWVLMIKNFDDVGIFTVSFGSILLGELLLSIIFQKFGNFFWTASGLSIIILFFLKNSITDVYPFLITNDILQLTLVFLFSLIASFLTGFSIHKAFPEKIE